jgi:hypothetical protein
MSDRRIGAAVKAAVTEGPETGPSKELSKGTVQRNCPNELSEGQSEAEAGTGSG